MILELALGDAYGSPFEYAPIEFVNERNDGLRFHRRRRNNEGRYTDDTQMSIAIGEAILYDERWTKDGLANRFVTAFKRDPRVGYANSFYGLLKEVQSGEELVERLKPDSDKSGGAMRAPLIGIFPSINEVKQKAAYQASITHNTEPGMAAAEASALMLHYFAYNLGPKNELGKFIQTHVAGTGWEIPYEGPVGAKGWMSVRAAMTAIQKHHTMTDILKACIAYTGDVDTVAAVALAAASMSNEIEKNLSPELYSGLENGPYGHDYLVSMDKLLMAKYQGFIDSSPFVPMSIQEDGRLSPIS
jgi:ADP-ribosyl-[dinitrogen reductase] hydrolase